METMILVAGLAVMGLAGIAAAFYFSMRPGGARPETDPRSTAGGAARTEDSQQQAGRSRTSRPPRSGNGRALDRTGPTGSSTVIDFTGPQQVLEEPEPVVTGRRARHGHTNTDDPAESPKSRRRVGWHKGSDADEELWPAEAFGGVSDEQFWDDLAADKPLTTTARTAQPDTAARRQPPASGPSPDLHPAGDRGRGNARRGPGDGPGTHPQPRLGPGDQAAERRGRSRASMMEEDPLTSPAYSLRPRGSVDGRGYAAARRSGDLAREQYEVAAGQQTQAFSLADAQAAGGGYPGGVPPFRQFDGPSPGPNAGRGRHEARRSDPLRPDRYRSDPLRSGFLRPDPLRPGGGYRGTVPSAAYRYPQQPYGQPTQTVNTPPYGGRRPVSQAGGNGDGSRASRPAYPPVNGSRGPHDPRGYDRRLTPLP